MNQGTPKISVNLTEQDKLICSNCQGDRFVQEMILLKIKSVLVGKRPGIVPKPIRFICSSCQTPIDGNTKTAAEIQKDEGL